MKKKIFLIVISIVLLSVFMYAEKFLIINDNTLKVYRLDAYDSFELTGDSLILKKADTLWSGSEVSVKINLVTELELQKYQKLEQMLKEGRTIPAPTKPGEVATGRILTVDWLKQDKKEKLTEDIIRFLTNPNQTSFDLTKWLNDYANWIPVR
ncbi:hypothetical protein [Petrotoga sp. 9PWA.NaAc.5.4]|uniref:hypothetical protein n=1 Tax=Petrotoga sp. 9PWA.NaAc.5.4 TaxID=1434328 RepID=UPI000CCAB916|nr:hypothetical protein [Petrotoga sp. 9PWA.NaAc.5.4]PNR94667.1 hypothetical protein X924_06145 [Petrotoga sp. 9PWA.NaAc.5.4]